MDFSKAISWVLNGQGVAFLGAGFGWEARNDKGERFPSAQDFAKNLQDELNITDEALSLLDASEEYMEQFGREALFKKIQSAFKLKDSSIDYSPFCKAPWKRIYTTNYDDLVERTYNKNSMRLQSLILNDSPSLILSNETNYIHVNGFVERMSLAGFDAEFKLTSSSYLSDIFISSQWKTVFNSDLKEAKAIIFVGYSLYDIDIQKILVEDKEIKEKCFFVTEPKPKDRIKRKLEKYGEVINIGVDGFISSLLKAQDNWIEDKKTFEYKSIEKIQSYLPIETPTSDDIISLFLYGNKKPSLIKANLINNKNNYYIYRRTINDIEYDLKHNQCILIHSKMANGKTLFIDGAAQHLIDKNYSVFKLIEGREISIEEIEHLKLEFKPILIIENYHRSINSIRLISSLNEDYIKLFLSGRTELHEIFCEQLDDFNINYEEIDLNNLNSSDILNLVNIMDNNGLFGDKSSLTTRQKEQYIKKELRSEFSLVLSHILKAPQIEERINKILEVITKDNSQREAILLCSIFSFLGHELHLFDLQMLLNSRDVGNIHFFKQQDISQLVHCDINNNVALKNTVLAKILIDNIVKKEPDLLLNLLTKVYIILAKNSEYEQKYKDIAKDLNIFSILSKIFGDNNLDKILDFYDQIKGHFDNESNHHFWLQYAIARLSNREYDIADRLMMSAYSIADKHKRYNRDWINSQYARLLIETAPLRQSPSDMTWQIKKAHSLIIGQDNHHYPFRVATGYFDFIEKNKHTLSRENIKEIILLAQEFNKKYHETLQKMRNKHHPVMQIFRKKYDQFKIDYADFF